jgi:hypothetical protein
MALQRVRSSFWNAMNPKKVTNILNAIEFYDDDYVGKAIHSAKLRNAIKKTEQLKPIIDTPDDIRNLVVFCRKHHRLKLTGIHTISLPIWLAICAVPARSGILSKKQILLAAERVKVLDEELASIAENNYEPHRL